MKMLYTSSDIVRTGSYHTVQGRS
uniref:Uncharacterized protein n=1 Tax=Anguilla anguilla TaxID=7936 RepID=A0A0E9SAD1_ANGAN